MAQSRTVAIVAPEYATADAIGKLATFCLTYGLRLDRVTPEARTAGKPGDELYVHLTHARAQQLLMRMRGLTHSSGGVAVNDPAAKLFDAHSRRHAGDAMGATFAGHVTHDVVSEDSIAARGARGIIHAATAIVDAFTCRSSDGPLAAAMLLVAVDPRVDAVTRLQTLVASRAGDICDILGAHLSPAAAREVQNAPRGDAAAFTVMDSIVWVAHSARAATETLDALKALAARDLLARSVAPAIGSTTPLVSTSRSAATLKSTRRGGAAEASLCVGDAPPADRDRVTPEDLHRFLFPLERGESPSGSRLLLFALHGPLCSHGFLLSGTASARHHVSTWELKSMCRALRHEDVMAVFMRGSALGSGDQGLRDVASLESELHAQARFTPPDMTPVQVNRMLGDLPRDTSGRWSFHDVQTRVLGARVARLAELRRMYPPVVSPAAPGAGAADAAAGSVMPHTLARASVTAMTSPSQPQQRLHLTFRPREPVFGRDKLPARVGVHGRVTAPSSSASPTRKMGPVEAAREREALMHRAGASVMELTSLHDKTAAHSGPSNLLLVRPSSVSASARKGRPRFDSSVALRLHRTGGGSHIPGAAYVDIRPDELSLRE